MGAVYVRFVGGAGMESRAGDIGSFAPVQVVQFEIWRAFERTFSLVSGLGRGRGSQAANLMVTFVEAGRNGLARVKWSMFSGGRKATRKEVAPTEPATCDEKSVDQKPRAKAPQKEAVGLPPHPTQRLEGRV